MDVLVIVNPLAGNGSPPPREVVDHCRAAGARVRVECAACRGDAIARAACASSATAAPALVVAVGGDGTVCEVAEGLARGLRRWADDEAEHPTPAARPVPALLAIPAGSGNSAYHAVWGDLDWREAVRLTFEERAHRVRELDLIRLVEFDRAALLGVNVGLVAAIATCIESEKDGRRGRPRAQLSEGASANPEQDEARYWSALSRALSEFRASVLRVSLDGRPLFEGATLLLTVGGVRRFGRGMFALLPQSLLDDALLDVCVTADVSPQRLGELAALVRSGEHVAEREVTYERGRRVRIERLDGEGLQIEHDGDPLRATRALTLEILPGAVPVIAPLESPFTKEGSPWSS